MTVLVVTTAADTLRGFDEHDVRRVETLGALQSRCPDATVVVVERPADATPRAALETVREAAPGTPVIRFGATDDPAVFDDVVEGDDSLETAVRLAVGAAAYRRAVDDLYERCLARAAGEDDTRAFYDALDRARRGFEDLCREVGETPYGSLLGPLEPEPDDVTAFRAALRGEEAEEQ